MSNTLCLLLLTFLFLSCENKETGPEQLPQHQSLIYFKTSTVAELGDKNWFELQPKLNDTIKVEYIDDIIFVSRFIEVNACTNYAGDVAIKRDSILLIHKALPGDACTSTAIDKVTYIIKNPQMKKYRIILKHE